MNISLELMLAAIIDDQDGEILLPLEAYEKDRGGKAIGIEYHEESHTLRLFLIEEKDLKDD